MNAFSQKLDCKTGVKNTGYKETACNLNFSFDNEEKNLQSARNEVTALNTRFEEALKATENSIMLEQFVKKRQEIEANLVHTIVPDDIKNNQMSNNICQDYKKIALAITIRDVLMNQQVVGKEIEAVIKEIEAVIKEISFSFQNDEIFMEKIKLRKTLIAATTDIISRLEQAHSRLQFTRATALSIEATKALYLIFYPAIDLAKGMDDAEKNSFKGELTAVIVKSVKAWNEYVANQSPFNIISARLYEQNHKMAIIQKIILKRSIEKQMAYQQE